ncbi:pyridoxal phosphate biosynthetic protein PdxA, partial [Alcanivorax marinus]|nr:pyridoxal phosphate biosynthetic protein PdxA [Alloalcanivorax marinus]
MIRPLALTSGDPAGIGPDLALTLAAETPAAPLVILGDRAVLADRARALGLDPDLPDWSPDR